MTTSPPKQANALHPQQRMESGNYYFEVSRPSQACSISASNRNHSRRKSWAERSLRTGAPAEFPFHKEERFPVWPGACFRNGLYQKRQRGIPVKSHKEPERKWKAVKFATTEDGFTQHCRPSLRTYRVSLDLTCDSVHSCERRRKQNFRCFLSTDIPIKSSPKRNCTSTKAFDQPSIKSKLQPT